VDRMAGRPPVETRIVGKEFTVSAKAAVAGRGAPATVFPFTTRKEQEDRRGYLRKEKRPSGDSTPADECTTVARSASPYALSSPGVVR